MINKVFIDTDIILDLLAQREQFYDSAAVLFSLIDLNKVKAFTSPVVIANIFYILSKLRNKSFALKNVKKIRAFLSILNLDEKIIDLASSSDFNDFEDSIQYYTSIENDIDYIITRNKKDFKLSKIPVFTAEEFLSQIKL